jgi:hypothetical protein
MKGLCSLGIVTLLVLTFGALPFPVSADSLCQTQNAAAPLWMTRPSGGGGGVSAQTTTCVAGCGNGTSVSTICNGTCTATDSNCPSYAGYVTCNGVYTYCNACSVPPDCDTVSGTSCSPRGSSTSCSRSDGWTYDCVCTPNNLWLCSY